MAIWRIAKLRVGWMVAGCAPGVLTILTSSLFQSTTVRPALDPAARAAATVPAQVECWDANTTVVVASVSTTPAKAMNDFFIVVPLSSMVCFLPAADIRRRYKRPRGSRNSTGNWGRMQSMGSSEPFLRVLAGHTYREPLQVFGRCLMPVYETSYRWTGNRLDAQGAPACVRVKEFSRLD